MNRSRATPMVPDAVAEPLGPGDPREIGRFSVLGLLGAGGMGEVYLGVCDGRFVAVKRMRPRVVSVERFNREVAILHRVPFGVAPAVLASDSTASGPWLATEYVPGLTVDDAVRAHGPLPADALWLLLAETAAHLVVVHRAGIVHRDLKPANIMLVRDGVKLIDFGIAFAADQSRLTRDGASSGTRGFVAPEQDAGSRDVAAPADVYSLAATLVYAASTMTPHTVPDLRYLRATDTELADLAERCLATDPAARPSAADLAAAARRRIGDAAPTWPAAVMQEIMTRRGFAVSTVEKMDTVLPVEPGPTVPTPERPSARRRQRIAIPLAAVAVLGGAIGIAAALMPDGKATTGLGTTLNIPTLSTTTPKPPAVSMTASAAGTDGSDDPQRIYSSGVTAYSVAGSSACAAWLDSDGSGKLAAVLNTSLMQSCGAELIRSDGLTYKFTESLGAKKTNFISDIGYTMWVCAWHVGEEAKAQCSLHFEMNGTAPVPHQG